MKRYMLTVAYDGTAYAGFQVQKEAKTIEGELNRVLTALMGQEIRVIGASRTDAGVHALCNAAVFDGETAIPAEKLPYVLNSRLPEDIRIQDCRETEPDFHPRHCSSRKTYEYRITRGRFPVPTRRLYSMFTDYVLDVERMRRGGAFLVGEHDFKSFCAAAAVVESTVRTIYEVSVEEQDADIVIRVCGSGFLYNMVRIIAGTLIEVGRGHFEPGEVSEILQKRARGAAGPTAPACGLTLTKYEFLG